MNSTLIYILTLFYDQNTDSVDTKYLRKAKFIP